MIVGVCGLGYSGSGAVVALLREYEETQVLGDFEFVFTYMPDGLEDLEYHLMQHCCRYYDSDMAIRRFFKYIKRANTKRSQLRRVTNNKIVPLTRDYLNKLIQVSWKGFWAVDRTHVGFMSHLFKMRLMTRVYKQMFKLTKRHWGITPNRDMYMSIKPENFYEYSKEYLEDIMNLMGRDSEKFTVLDQPFSGDNPENSFKFFNEPKAIIVDRDPRDLYIVAKRIGSIIGRFMPVDDVKTYVEYYRLIHENTAKNEDKNKVLRIRFEDLLYEYENTVSQIEEFIGINNHVKPRECFKPHVSINNTQLFHKFKDMEDDVKYIEEHLSEYLYPFENYPPIVHTGKSF